MGVRQRFAFQAAEAAFVAVAEAFTPSAPARQLKLRAIITKPACAGSFHARK